MANKKITFELDIDGKPIDVVIDKTLNLKQQVRELTKELNKTQEGTDQFRLLSSKLNETKDNVDRVNAKSRELFGTLSLLPGPIGDFGNKIDGSINLLKTFSGFKLSDISNQFKELGKDALDIVKNILGLNVAQKTLAVSEAEATAAAVAETAALEVQTVATTEAEVATIGLGTALKAIGIGLLIAGIAALVVYWDDLKNAFSSTTAATKALNAENDILIKNSKSQVASLEVIKIKTEAAGKSLLLQKQAVKEYNDEFGKTLGPVKDYIELQNKLEGPEFEKYKAYLVAKAKVEADAAILTEAYHEQEIIALERNQRRQEAYNNYKNTLLKARGKLTQADLDANISWVHEIYDNIDKDLAGRTKETNQKITEAKKLLLSNTAQVVSTGVTGAPETTTTTTKEDPRVQQKKDTIKAIDDLVQKSFMDSLSAQDKELYQTNQHYSALTFDATRFGLDTTLLKEQQGKDVLAINKKYDDLEKDRQEKAGKFIQDWELKFQQDSQKALDKTANDKGKTRSNELQQQMDNIDVINKLLDEDSAADLERLKAKGLLMDEQEKIELSNTELTEDAKTQIRQKYKDKRTALLLEEVDAEKRAAQEKANIMLLYADSVSAIGSIIGSLAGKNVELQKLAILLEKGAAIAKIVINAAKDVSAVTGAAQAAGWLAGGPILNPVGYAANVAAGIASASKIKIVAGLSIASIAAQGLGQFMALNDQGGGGAEKSKPTIENKPGYAEGGLLDGPRHAQGGMTINAEGGEAVMTRGAVTMFKPLLSMMNQAGGGTSFTKGAAGQAGYDNPTTSSSSIMEPQIIKTYVVENELTTIQHKQARLKDLSTL